MDESGLGGTRRTVFFSVMIGAFSLGQGAPNLESVAKARGAAYAIYNTIDMPRPIDSSSKDGFKPDIVKGDIEFKNIHFSYPSRKDVKILQGMNLKVPRGKTIALVGASGCGKSTTIQLLQRFYDPDAGECSTIGRRLHHAGLHAHRPLPRLSLTPRHRHQRLQWCRTRLSWSDSERQRVIFSDESLFSLGGDAQRIRVWRHRGQHRDERFTPTRPEGLVSLHLHPYRTICRNCVRMFKLHGMDYHRTPLGTSTAPYRDVWHVGLANTEARRHADRQTSVTLDGRDIRTLNVRWLRENMGIVSQEPVLFGTTIAENIRYGREDATDEDIERAVREANAYEFISKLPDKMNTMVGERGAQLSGGQKQRIAIARALVKNPKILLLDEATSALDTQSESIVQAALDKARAGRTTIVIAHRLSTIRTADVIAGFKDGQVVEQGTHGDLMNKKGIYYSLVMQQTSGRPEEPENISDGEICDQSSDEDTSDDVNAGKAGNGSFARISSKRSASVRRRTTKRSSRKNSRKDKQDTKEEEKAPDIPFKRILALNKPEWPYLLVGTLASFVGGAVYPCVAILFAKIIGVFSELDADVKRQKTLMFSLLFLLVGTVAFVTYFFQDIAWFDDHNNAVGVLTTKLATDASLVKG
ncbi:hypothetical protein NFI96_007635, partial [Prochilodus magdalenae]